MWWKNLQFGIVAMEYVDKKEKEMKKIILGLIFLFIFGCSLKEDEVSLTRRIFTSLCQGDQRIENLIDWENFKAVDVDVGKTYSAILSNKERYDYRKAFFYNFAYSFKASGGRIDNFFNWRLYDRQSDKITVAADTRSGKVILFTLILKDGKHKLCEIKWQ